MKALLAILLLAASSLHAEQADLCIYEATPGGIAMAVRAAREGLNVILVNHNAHLGGILSSGLGVWDTLWEGKRSPIYDEARQAIFDHYRTTYGEKSPQYRDALPGKSGHSNGKFEPHVAEAVLTRLITQEKNVTVIRGYYPTAVQREGPVLKSITIRELDGPGEKHITAKIFADCSYEGDLAAVAKVPYRLGREARAEFNEPHAGVIYMAGVKTAPTPEIERAAKLHASLNLRKFSGLQAIKEPESTGEADGNVQAFNYRTPLSSDPANRLPVEKPADYDPEKLKLLEHGSIVSPIPNLKRGWNRPQLVGLQTDYVEADWPGRRKVMDAHWSATIALLYFLQNDPSVDPARQKSWRDFGLAKDEFPDNAHRPYEFYIREARRITGRYIFTQHDAMLVPGLDHAPLHEDSIATTEWYLDTHACTPRHIPGALEEGKMMLDVETFPGQVPYRAILPQGIDNLLVPVCLSSTHVAWGTIRTQHVMVTFFNDLDVSSDDPRIPAAQYFATKGFFADYNARLDEPLKESTRNVWGQGLAALRAGTLQPMDLIKQVREAEAADSPLLDRPRGESLLRMWKSLQTPAPKTKAQVTPLRSSSPQDVAEKHYDLIVVGGTPAGIACAVRASREGLTVLLVQHNKHIGGMLTNALMQWDALWGGPRAPIFNEYAKKIEDHYRETYGADSKEYASARYTQSHYPMSRFEPSVAERLFNQLVSAEKNITTLLSHYPAKIDREKATLKTLTLREYGTTHDIRVDADTYVDATYEGDLAALAQVPCRIGRESREEFHEPHAGKIFTNITPESGPQAVKDGTLNLHLYAHTQGSIDPTSPFTADGAVQAYNHRFCLSNDPGNIRLPEKPPGYNREEYLHYNRKGMGSGSMHGKSSFNSAILPGENHQYPAASWPEREKIIARHTNFALGLMFFLQNDESIPPAKREGYRRIGLPLDEYPDNHNLPYELYVREARRIVGRHIFSEHDNTLSPDYARTPIHPDSIAFTDWSMDSHDCTTDRHPGYDYDGKLILTEESRPAQIPYRCLLPKDVDNLLVPVCLSATHVAWGAIRLEPVWMQIGEATGWAAVLSKQHHTTPGKLKPDLLVRKLVEKQHLVSFFNDIKSDATDASLPAAQYFATKGFFAGYNARLNDPVKRSTARNWINGVRALHQGIREEQSLAADISKAESTDSPSYTLSDWSKERSLPPDKAAADRAMTRGELLQQLYEFLR
ncbi:FAD-dependent oxidoreductase [Prosthecobacter sp.]|uniref:FAD-dependent oxidoreductase n=1 Tax=Prosthecobacter sp. TaxID=1965333 RepID=UPI0037847D5E